MERIVVGQVAGAHGLKGQLRVRHFGDEASDLAVAVRVILSRDEAGLEGVEHSVVSVAAGRRGELRMVLEGVSGRGAAEDLKGRWVLLDPADLAPTEEDEYYGYELVGCRVEDESGAAIGTVRDIWFTGAADVLVVEADDGAQHLIPMAKEILREVDVPGRRIAIEPMPGLLEPDRAVGPAGPDTKE